VHTELWLLPAGVRREDEDLQAQRAAGDVMQARLQAFVGVAFVAFGVMTLVETLQKQGRERPCCVWWTERASFPRFAPDQCCPLLCLRRTRQVCRGHSECSSGYCHPMRKQCAGKKCKANGDCRTGFCGAGKYVASVRARPVRRAAQTAVNMC